MLGKQIRVIAAVLMLIFITLAGLGLGACAQNTQADSDAAKVDVKPDKEKDMVTVRLINEEGKLTEPVELARYSLTDEQWREKLDEMEYKVSRHEGTERAFTGKLNDNKQEGAYLCVSCGLPVFASSAKFDSGTGWPSFWEPIAKENVATREDRNWGMTRVEVHCPRCGGHLGHVFDDGPQPTGLRYCMNSAAMKFAPYGEALALLDGADDSTPSDHSTESAGTAARADGLAEAVFAGGCFWCVEAVFEQLDGVKEAVSGYAGGSAETANYQAVCNGDTGHAEAVKIIYDPSKISYEKLLEVHFETHNPTTLNRQGADVGTQYRSAIFYANEQEKAAAEAYISKLEKSGKFDKKIVTTLEPLEKFYEAEKYHQNFVDLNPNQGYVQAVAVPKVQKTRSKYADLLKPELQQ